MVMKEKEKISMIRKSMVYREKSHRQFNVKLFQVVHVEYYISLFIQFFEISDI